VEISLHAVSALKYLEQKKVIHRDLALRNFLVGTHPVTKQYVIKLSDFGMARMLDSSESVFWAADRIFEVKQNAPEVYKGTYTTKSDVWSFGILLWDLFNYGAIPPYATMTDSIMMEKIQAGYRLPSPKECPEQIYKVQLRCWNQEPNERPTFRVLSEEMNTIREELRFKTVSKKQSTGILQTDENGEIALEIPRVWPTTLRKTEGTVNI